MTKIEMSKEKKETILIAFIIPSMGDGGSNKFMLRVAQGMVKRGFLVDLIVIDGRGQYADYSYEGVRRFTITPVSGKGLTVAKTLWYLIKYNKAEQPNIIMSATTAVNIITLAASRLFLNQPSVIVSERNAIRQSTLAASGTSKYYEKAISLLYQKATKIIVVSNGVKNELIDYYGLKADMVKVIYNPVVSDCLQRLSEEPVLDSWYQDCKVPVILSVGRLHSQKDFKTLIEGFSLLRKNMNARLMILGEGSMRQELEELVRAYDLTEHVRMPGFKPNPYAYMSKASLFVMTSVYEGVCNVIIEALACGCPVVATDCAGGGPSEILDKGAWGKLVPVADVKKLSLAMEESLQSEHDSSSYVARASFFSVDKGMNKYEKLFRSLA